MNSIILMPSVSSLFEFLGKPLKYLVEFMDDNKIGRQLNFRLWVDFSHQIRFAFCIVAQIPLVSFRKLVNIFLLLLVADLSRSS